MSVFGMPGPGGSMGKCAVCGDDFATGVLMDLSGHPSGITEFSVGFVEQRLFAHDPKCTDAVKAAFVTKDKIKVQEALPSGPLRECLEGI